MSGGEPAVLIATSGKGTKTHWWFSISKRGKRKGWVSACGRRAKIIGPPYEGDPSCIDCHRAL